MKKWEQMGMSKTELWFWRVLGSIVLSPVLLIILVLAALTRMFAALGLFEDDSETEAF